MKIHLNIHIFGTVQRVGFRYHTRAKTASLGLAGFVRNMPDGSVYVEVEGDEKTVREFEDWCRKGPPLANVESISSKEGPLQNFEAFIIQNGWY